MANSNGNSNLTDSDEIFELCCDLCSKNGIRNAEVDGFCSDCLQYFCAACLRFHQIFLPLHKQLDKHDMPKDVCTDSCTMHSDNVIKFYCKHCEEFICSKCKTENHEQCHEVQFLPLLVKDIENSRELADFVSILNQFETELDNTKTSINSNLGSIQVMREETLDTLNKQRLEIQNNFVTELDEVNRTIQTVSDKDRLKSESDMNKVLFIFKSLNVIKQELSDRKIAGQRCKLYSTLIKSKPKISKLEQDLQDIQQKISMTKFKYKPKNYTVQMQDIGELEINGELLKTENKDRFQELDGNHHEVLRENFDNTTKEHKECTSICMQLGFVVAMITIAFWFRILTLQGSYEIQIAFKVQTVDMPSIISKFCILDDDILVGFDNFDRLIIKRESRIIPFRISDYELWAIVKISATKVAITIPEKMAIEIYKINSNQLRTDIDKELEINVDSNPYGIDYIDENLFVVVYCEETEETYMRIFNLEGSLLKTIAMGLHGNNIHVSPFKMTLDTSKDYKVYQTYVLDALEQQVIGLKIHENTYQSFYNHNIGNDSIIYSGFSWKVDKDFDGPTAMAIDMEGYVYVCCDKEGNIYRISSDLKTATVVLGTDKDMPKPTSMVFKLNKLFIASAQSYIRIFEIRKSYHVCNCSWKCLQTRIS